MTNNETPNSDMITMIAEINRGVYILPTTRFNVIPVIVEKNTLSSEDYPTESCLVAYIYWLHRVGAKNQSALPIVDMETGEEARTIEIITEVTPLTLYEVEPHVVHAIKIHVVRPYLEKFYGATNSEPEHPEVDQDADADGCRQMAEDIMGELGSSGIPEIIEVVRSLADMADTATTPKMARMWLMTMKSMLNNVM